MNQLLIASVILSASITYLASTLLPRKDGMDALCLRIKKWMDAKGITEHGTPQAQALKCKEELFEQADELARQFAGEHRLMHIKDETGDCLVTQIVMCYLHGWEPSDVLSGAVAKIEKRTGSMRNGVFVKD